MVRPIGLGIAVTLSSRVTPKIVVAGANTQKTRERAVGEGTCWILRRFEQRWDAVDHAFFSHHVGSIGANHEAGCRGRDRIAFVFLKGGRADERDRTGDAIADRMRLDFEAWRRRPLVVD